MFIDEIDKLSRSSSASYSKDVSGEGVQQALLKILEGTIVSVPDKDGNARRKGTFPLRALFISLITSVRSGRIAKRSLCRYDQHPLHSIRRLVRSFLSGPITISPAKE